MVGSAESRTTILDGFFLMLLFERSRGSLQWPFSSIASCMVTHGWSLTLTYLCGCFSDSHPDASKLEHSFLKIIGPLLVRDKMQVNIWQFLACFSPYHIKMQFHTPESVENNGLSTSLPHSFIHVFSHSFSGLL